MANTLHQLKRATEIVERYRARGNVFPRELRDCGRGDPETQQGIISVAYLSENSAILFAHPVPSSLK